MNKIWYRIATLGLASGLQGQDVSGQDLLSLEPLKPASVSPSDVAIPPGNYAPLPPIFDSTNITLEAIPRSPASAAVQYFVNTTSQIEVQPLKPAASAKVDPKAGQLRVDSMIGRQKDSIELFSKLNIENNFLASASLAPIQRVQTENDYPAVEWSSQGYGWHSPAFCHSPLYFEQPNFERYGTRNPYYLAPTLSAAHFFGSAALLPLKAFHQPPWCKSCTLGNRRPGDCNPIQRHPSEH